MERHAAIPVRDARRRSSQSGCYVRRVLTMPILATKRTSLSRPSSTSKKNDEETLVLTCWSPEQRRRRAPGYPEEGPHGNL